MLSHDKVNFFRALSRLKDDDLTHVVKHIDSKGIESICECVFNTIYNDLNVPKSKRKKIKGRFLDKKNLRNLKIITDKKRDTLKKKKAILQEGKGIGLILSTVAPILASLISKAVS